MSLIPSDRIVSEYEHIPRIESYAERHMFNHYDQYFQRYFKNLDISIKDIEKILDYIDNVDSNYSKSTACLLKTYLEYDSSKETFLNKIYSRIMFEIHDILIPKLSKDMLNYILHNILNYTLYLKNIEHNYVFLYNLYKNRKEFDRIKFLIDTANGCIEWWY